MTYDDSYPGVSGGLQTLATADGEPDLDLGQGARLAEFAVGEVLDRYIVEAPIGRGGVATVYRVRHARLGTRHALKVLNAPGPQLTERLLAEGRLLAPWRHPNIVRVQDAFEVSGGLALLMELVEGPTLAGWIAEHPQGLPVDQIEAMFGQVLDAVAYAHEQEVVHRDLKSSNILLASDGQGGHTARVTDFGIAKVLGEQIHSMLTDTRTGAMLGTPAYMAPEQVDEASRVDARADLFALGVILYEMCAGARPFEGPSVWAVLEAVRQVSLVPIQERRPELPAPLIEAIEACLVREPDRRVPDAHTLAAILGGEPWEAPAATAAGASHGSPPTRPGKRESAREAERGSGGRGRALRWGGSAVAMSVVGALGALVMSQHGDLERASRDVDGLSRERDGLARALEGARLERRAWRHAHTDPARAVALLRAAGQDRASERAHPALLELMMRGGASQALPAPDEVYRVAVSLEAGLVAGLMTEGVLKVWEIETGRPVFERDARVGTSYRDVRFVRGGDWLVVSHAGGESAEELGLPARVFDARTGEVLHTFSHGKRTLGLATSPGERWAVTSDFREGIQLWDLSTGGPLERLDVFDVAAENSLVFSPDGRWLAGMERVEGVGKLVDTRTWRLHQKLELPRGTRPRVMFTPDASAVLMARGGELRAWDVASGELVARRRTPTGLLLDVNARQDRVLVGSEGDGAMLLRWPDLEPVAPLDGHRARTIRASFFEGAPLALTTSSDRDAIVWSPRDGRELVRLQGHGSWVLDGRGFVQGDSIRVATGGRDHTLRLWSLPGLGQRHEPFPVRLRGPRAWAQGGQLAAGLGEDGAVWLWHEGQPARAIDPGSGVVVERVELEPERGWLVVGTRRSGCQIYALEDASPVFTVQLMHEGTPERCHDVQQLGPGRDDPVAASFLHWIAKVDPRTGQVGERWRQHSMKAWTWSPEAGRGFFRRLRNALVFVDERFEILAEVDAQGQAIASMRLLAGGQAAVVSYWGGTIERWDLRTSQRVWRREGFPDSLSRVETSADGRLVAVGSPDGVARILEASTGRTLHELTGHQGDILALAFSPDGDQLATASRDGTARVWSTRSGAALGMLWTQEPALRLAFDEAGGLRAWLRGGAMQRWELTAELEGPSDWLSWTGRLNNYRVCRVSLRAVPVVPFPPASSVWAPDELCETISARGADDASDR